MRRSFVCLVAISMMLASTNLSWAQSEEPQESKEQESKEKESSWFFDGYLDFLYSAQTNQDQTDQDYYQTMSFSFGESKTRWITGYVSARMTWDLDGHDHPDSFLSISDTFGSSYIRLNSAYVDLRPERFPLEVVRLGRQWLSEIPEVVRMDGVRLETPALERTLRTRLILFGGVPEHLSESSRSDDRVYGMGLEFMPSASTRVTGFYSRIKDVYKEKWVDDSDRVSARDDLINVELRQGLFENKMSLYGSYSNLNGESRDSRMRMSYVSEDGRWGANLNYRILYKTQHTLSTELDPYTSVLRSYNPYQELGIDLRRDLTDRLIAEAGAMIRRLDDDDDKGAFNHEFERYYLSGTLKKWPLEESEVMVIGDLYDADGDRFWELGGSWSHDLTEALNVEVGTAYAIYHEDRYTYEERNHVRSGFVRLDYDLMKDVTLNLDYTAEKDDDYTTHRWEVGVRYQFSK